MSTEKEKSDPESKPEVPQKILVSVDPDMSDEELDAMACKIGDALVAQMQRRRAEQGKK
jgi:hypothetical protein